jgi:hypothetical protein
MTSIVGAHGSYGGSGTWSIAGKLHATGSDGRLIQFDPSLTSDILGVNSGMVDGSGAGLGCYEAVIFDTGFAGFGNADLTMAKDITVSTVDSGTVDAAPASVQRNNTGVLNIRRLNQVGTWANSAWTADAVNGTHVLTVMSGTFGVGATCNVGYVLGPARNSGGSGDSLVVPTFESDFGAGAVSPVIPEIDIKIESIAVTAATRKLRARWSPELAQDLNAYHSLDAEVELTQILSEQIALEIDREILNDLLTGAAGANLFWSRAPG